MLPQVDQRAVGDLDDLGGLECPRLGRSAEFVEQAHLAEQVAVSHQRDHRFAAVERLVADRDAPGLDDVQRVGLAALGKDHITPHQVERPGLVEQLLQDLVAEVGEQLDGAEHRGIDHSATLAVERGASEAGT